MGDCCLTAVAGIRGPSPSGRGLAGLADSCGAPCEPVLWAIRGWAVVELDQVGAEGQAGQVGATAAAGPVPDAVQVGADRTRANVQLGGDLGVGPALGDQGDQFLFPGTELPMAWRRCGGLGW
jgi:hypothetical protein